ncbi:MAG TPA: hypothetical protein DHW71_07340 [Gammaproteobacteria bacterium]|nr:hypothetical protein [Gammaproteobacteria bacterium]HCK92782.1 hypothetical protein [Gammaproteobacteria bacterium]
MNGGLNRFGYVGGNPVSFNDPLGQSATAIVQWGGRFTLAAAEIGTLLGGPAGGAIGTGVGVLATGGVLAYYGWQVWNSDSSQPTTPVDTSADQADVYSVDNTQDDCDTSAADNTWMQEQQRIADRNQRYMDQIVSNNEQWRSAVNTRDSALTDEAYNAAQQDIDRLDGELASLNQEIQQDSQAHSAILELANNPDLYNEYIDSTYTQASSNGSNVLSGSATIARPINPEDTNTASPPLTEEERELLNPNNGGYQPGEDLPTNTAHEGGGQVDVPTDTGGNQIHQNEDLTTPPYPNRSDELGAGLVYSQSNGSNSNKKGPYSDRRPTLRKGTKTNAWDNAADGSVPNSKACPDCGNDVFGNPNNGELRNTPQGWDLEHVNKWETLRQQLEARGASPKEYRDVYNDLNNTILRCRTCNRSDNQL